MNRFSTLCVATLACIGTAGALSLSPLLHVRPESKPDATPAGRSLLKTTPAQAKPDKNTRVRPNDAVNPGIVGIGAPDGETYSCSFDTPEEFEGFTVIDANSDAHFWNRGEDGYAFIGYNTAEAMDDWLISPAIRLEAGNTYIVSIEARASSTSYPERLAIYMGKGTTVADATETLVEPTMVKSSVLSAFGDFFTPAETGDYHIMVHGCSDADMSTLVVDNFKVSSPGAQPIPGDDAIAYSEVVLFEQDFSKVGGSVESPLPLEGEGHYLQGLEGWRGYDAYGIGGAVMINEISGTSGWAQIAPPKVKFTNETALGYLGRIEMEAQVVELGEQAVDYYGNPYEGLSGTGMVGSSECPNGWRWGGNNGDFNFWINQVGEWKEFSKDVRIQGTGALLNDDFDESNPGEIGTYHIDNYSARITAFNGSNLAVRKYKVIELIPELAPIATWAITEYNAEGFTIAWDAVEGADRYVVDLYEGDAGGYAIERIDRKVVTSPTCAFEIATSDGRALYATIFSCKGDKRSPLSPTRRIFAVNAPTFGPLEAPVNGTLTVPFTCDPTSQALEVYALGGKKMAEAQNGLEIANISFASFPDQEANDNTPYAVSLGDQTPGWICYPQPSYEGGAFKRNNGMASWGYVDFMTVIGQSAYDFSNVTGKVKVAVTAKTDGNCLMSVNLKSFDSVERYFVAYSTDSKQLTGEYDTYVFEVDPQGRDNVYVEVTTGGADTSYIKDIKVTCDVEANKTFLMPFLVGAIDMQNNSITSGNFTLQVPDGLDKIRITGQAYRGLIQNGSLYFNARSFFAEPAEFSFVQENSLENPLPMPYYEGFDNASFTQPAWEAIAISGEVPTIHPVSTDPTTGLFPYSTRDKGFLVIENDKAGEFYFVSPYIYIDDNQEDALIHWAYYRNSGVSITGVVQYDGGEWEEDNSLSDWGSDQMNPQWTSVSTSGWPAWGSQAGKVFRYGWKVTTDGQGGVYCIDNIGFRVMPVYDLGLVLPHVTPAAKPGQAINASVEVGVFGQLSTTKFNVTAKLDGEVIGNVGNPANNPWGENRTKCEFPLTLPEDIALGEHEVTFELEFEGDYAGKEDSDLSNNIATVTFDVVGEYLPEAVGLTADRDELTWTVPAKGERFTDNIEGLESFADGDLDVVYGPHPIYDYDVFAKAYGNRGTIAGYTVIDADGKPTNTDDNWVAENVPNIFHLMSCTVADFTVETDGFNAASGNKALLFWSNADGTPTDNYLVMPRLNDADRYFSFMARAYDGDNPEKIEILVSSTDDEAESFTAIRTVDIESDEYTLIECTLPDGAKYVAIRQISDEGYGLVVDDITFAMEPRPVVGYNVYLEGVKVNDTPLAEARFKVATAGNYSVSVVYDEGESARTAEIYIDPLAIDAIGADNAEEAVYYNLQGIRVANPTKGVYIKVQGNKSTKVMR